MLSFFEEDRGIPSDVSTRKKEHEKSEKKQGSLEGEGHSGGVLGAINPKLAGPWKGALLGTAKIPHRPLKLPGLR